MGLQMTLPFTVSLVLLLPALVAWGGETPGPAQVKVAAVQMLGSNNAPPQAAADRRRLDGTDPDPLSLKACRVGRDTALAAQVIWPDNKKFSFNDPVRFGD